MTFHTFLTQKYPLYSDTEIKVNLTVQQLCELVEEFINAPVFEVKVIEKGLILSELKDLLCNVSQLIQGWNATELEWSEWDKQVQSQVHELQIKIDGLKSVNFS